MRRYLDLMVDLLLVRRLVSWRKNVGKRLVKAPRSYLRDSGICHALLGIVHGGDESYPLRDGVEAVSMGGICGELAP